MNPSKVLIRKEKALQNITRWYELPYSAAKRRLSTNNVSKSLASAKIRTGDLHPVIRARNVTARLNTRDGIRDSRDLRIQRELLMKCQIRCTWHIAHIGDDLVVPTFYILDEIQYGSFSQKKLERDSYWCTILLTKKSCKQM